MRFIVLGTSELTLSCARALLETGSEVCAMVSMPSHIRPDNFANVSDFAIQNQIPYFETVDINSDESLKILSSYSPDYIFVTWPKILNERVLAVPKVYCIGTHPTDLPSNRGRHPLHWIIVLGISTSKFSFFKMDSGIDSGNILAQVNISFSFDDLIGNVVEKINNVAYEGTKNLVDKLLQEPSYSGWKQDKALATYWRMRTPHDITLDLRMTRATILRTVRSFAPPYDCAKLIFEQNILKITRASIASEEITPKELQRIEPGKIMGIQGNIISVKVDDGVVDLECRGNIPPVLKNAKYIHPPTKYILSWPTELRTNLF